MPKLRTFATAVATALVVVLPGCSKPTDSSAASGRAAAASAASSTTPGVAVAPGPAGARPPGGPSFASGFEGAIVMHATSPRGPTEMLFLTKGGKLRIETPGRDGQMTHSIFDPEHKKLTLLLDSQQMAMQMAIPEIAAAAPAASATTVTRTGRHETVAGYDCEDWDVAIEGGKREAVCVAQGLAFFDFMAMAGSTGGTSRSWAEELREKNGFPLRAVELDATGKEISRMEVTKVEKRALDDSAFLPPPGYQVMNLPAMAAGGPHPRP